MSLQVDHKEMIAFQEATNEQEQPQNETELPKEVEPPLQKTEQKEEGENSPIEAQEEQQAVETEVLQQSPRSFSPRPIFIDESIPYMIICCHNQFCLDWNTKQARQVDRYHPRACLSSQLNPCVRSQLWNLRRVLLNSSDLSVPESGTSLSIPVTIETFLLCANESQDTVYATNNGSGNGGNGGTPSFAEVEERALDANIQSHISQWDYAFPMPFLYGKRETHLNQLWRLHHVGNENANTFCIVNQSHGKCLDGNVDLCGHADLNYKSPYLRQFKEQQPIRSQMWKIHPVIAVSYDRIPSGNYLIVNVSNGRCLDSQPDKNGQTSSLHPCVFLGEKSMYNPCLHWHLKAAGNDSYILSPRFDPDTRQLSGKQEINETTTIPFLVHNESLLHVHVEEDVPYRLWKIFAAPGDDTFFIVCTANGLCISGSSYSYPTMEKVDLVDPTATETMWRLIPILKKRQSSRIEIDEIYLETKQ